MVWSFVFYLGLTIFGVPYVSMGYEMSDDYHERTSVMAISQWIGQWAWVIAPWFWVIMYDPAWFRLRMKQRARYPFGSSSIYALCHCAGGFHQRGKHQRSSDYEPLDLRGILQYKEDCEEFR